MRDGGAVRRFIVYLCVLARGGGAASESFTLIYQGPASVLVGLMYLKWKKEKQSKRLEIGACVCVCVPFFGHI